MQNCGVRLVSTGFLVVGSPLNLNKLGTLQLMATLTALVGALRRLSVSTCAKRPQSAGCGSSPYGRINELDGSELAIAAKPMDSSANIAIASNA